MARKLHNFIAFALGAAFAIALATSSGWLFRGYTTKDMTRALVVSDHEVQVIWTTGHPPVNVHIRTFEYMAPDCLGLAYPLLWGLDRVRKKREDIRSLQGLPIEPVRASTAKGVVSDGGPASHRSAVRGKTTGGA